MSKGLNLVDTAVIEFTLRRVGADAKLTYLVEVLDDAGDVVRHDLVDVNFSDLPTQQKATLNNFMRLLSKDANNAKVNENSVTWVDI